MSERAHYHTLRQHLCQHPDRMDRVENGVMAGMPDINMCSHGVEVWIEMKSPREPRRSTTPLFGSNHPVSQDQLNWFLRHTRAGGRGYLLISTNAQWLLVPGACLEAINTLSLEAIVAIAVWRSRKPVHEWAGLRTQLFQKGPHV